MTGLHFIGLLEVIDEIYGTEMLLQVVASASLSTDGKYEANATYDAQEFIDIILSLSHLSYENTAGILQKIERHEPLAKDWFSQPTADGNIYESLLAAKTR